MNGDGKLDLITACFEGGLYVLDGLGGGRFAAPRGVLDKEGAVLRLGQYWDDEEDEWTGVEASHYPDEHGISCTPVDWDDDGDMDLLLGASSGLVFLRLNEGSAKEPAYEPHSTKVQAAGEDLKAPGGQAAVLTADWDLDGRWDLLAGTSSGAVVWYRNVGEKKAPEFAAGELLVEETGQMGSTSGEPTRPGTRLQIGVGDHNGDGLPDLLVGDHMMVSPEGPDLSDEEKGRLSELRDQRQELYEEMSAISERLQAEGGDFRELGESDADYQALIERLQESHLEISLLEPPPAWRGWVWLYEREPAPSSTP